MRRLVPIRLLLAVLISMGASLGVATGVSAQFPNFASGTPGGLDSGEMSSGAMGNATGGMMESGQILRFRFRATDKKGRSVGLIAHTGFSRPNLSKAEADSGVEFPEVMVLGIGIMQFPTADHGPAAVQYSRFVGPSGMVEPAGMRTTASGFGAEGMSGLGGGMGLPGGSGLSGGAALSGGPGGVGMAEAGDGMSMDTGAAGFADNSMGAGGSGAMAGMPGMPGMPGMAGMGAMVGMEGMGAGGMGAPSQMPINLEAYFDEAEIESLKRRVQGLALIHWCSSQFSERSLKPEPKVLAQYRSKLSELLESEYALRLDNKEKELAQLEAKVAELRRDLQRRREATSDVVAFEVKRRELGAQGLEMSTDELSPIK